MELFSLLAETGLPVIGQTFDVALNWIGRLIRWLCDSVGVVGVGIILFSLILKLITLPFDIGQRISMRKQNIQMKANQEKMEKLQKQYANDKDLYNQKVMEMYKENGFSAFSACLPMILSLVIFIVAINAFNAYAQYANVENYNTLVEAYNADMKKNCAVLTKEQYDDMVTVGALSGDSYTYTVKDDTSGKYVYYKLSVPAATHEEMAVKTAEEKVAALNAIAKREYYVDEVRAIAEDAQIKAFVETYKAIPENADHSDGDAVKAALRDSAQSAVVVEYQNKIQNKTKFVWIKNIWETDASYKNPVVSASDFITDAKSQKFKVDNAKVKYEALNERTGTNAYTPETYNDVTAKLIAEKKAANGYFILIALSIGTILLQQFVSMRSQKEQQKYSSVDGSSGTQQKMTMFIMTGMFAIFSFMYSSAFSIYMITSNLFSLLSTLVINKLVDARAEKKETQKEVARLTNSTMDRIEKAKNAGKESAEQSKKNK